MSSAKDKQQLKSNVTVATNAKGHAVPSANGDEVQMTPDVVELSQRSYISYYSDRSANGDANLVTTGTIKLDTAVNPDVKELDYLVVLATGDEEIVTTNVQKLGHTNDYLVPLATGNTDLVATNVSALGHVSDYLVPLATGDKDLVTTNVLELGHASDCLSVLTTRDDKLVKPNQVNIGYSDDAQYMHLSLSTQLSTATVDYSGLSAAKPEGKCNLVCFKVSFLH